MIEPMTAADLPRIHHIEQKSFHRPWTVEGFKTELEREPSVCLTVKIEDRIVGYLVFWRVRDEIHILNIAVDPDSRKQGLGRLLLDYMVDYGRELGVRDVYLEVRTSNAAARNLYRRMGFGETGIRKNYYSEDHEDAVVMSRSL